jgi:ComF family protein
VGLVRGFYELTVPPVCFACGERSLTPLCDGCVTAIEPIEEPVCPICGRPVIYDVEMCAKCRDDKPLFDMARALAVYDFPMREAVLGLKTRQGRGLADFLAPRFVNAFRDEIAEADALTYVPVSPGRLRKRGFNQAKELALAVSGLSGCPVVDALKMVRPVKDQGQLDKAKRRENVEAAFVVRKNAPSLIEQELILVDDVITTGSTASACAKALKEAGAARLTVLTLARAVPT